MWFQYGRVADQILVDTSDLYGILTDTSSHNKIDDPNAGLLRTNLDN